MDVLITAGGNTEKIDDVRSIRNKGTGRLGALVAERLAAGGARIFYICDHHAVTPRAGGVTVVHAGDVTALGGAVRRVCAERRMDAVVHSMAVSDYRVKNVTTAKAAALCAAGMDDPDRIAGAIMDAPPANGGGKISSDNDGLLVVLERAPKVISMFRGLAPDAVIVGFKLLSGVSEGELIQTGYGLLRRNDCDYVLANDMESLKDGGHIGHLIGRDGSYKTYDGKEAIADAIAAAVTGGQHE
jgi:phosphopantothenate-cysteine ligase